MWNYERRLQYPVNITRPNAEMAKVIISQFGGPDGEVGAAMRYLSQRYSNTNRKVAGVLTDIGVSVGKLRMGECFYVMKSTFTVSILHISVINLLTSVITNSAVSI